MPDPRPGIQTIAIHAGAQSDPTTGAVVTPLYLSTTYDFGSTERGMALFSGEEQGYTYTRWGNPTVDVLQKRVAALEGGQAALATASGMTAIAMSLLSVLKAGDHIVSARALYPSAYHFIEHHLGSLGIESTFVDATDLKNVANAIRPNTRILYVESPANPLLALVDLEGVAQLGRAANAITICDNTFATPINQQPLKWGIEVVVHAATKYLDGHGDCVGGVIIGSEEFIRQANVGTLRYYGGILSPFNSYLILRGIQTLPLRMRQHNANALAVARYLESHPQVGWVSYPGLESHPQHALARKQMTGGYSGMICFEVRGGLETGARMMNRVKLCTLATSLGDVRSLISHPASTTHSVLPREKRELQGITDGLIRFSVGLEDVQDIIADLEQALA
ncbi:MAG: aminotransferase class I/II-fold pyridoxal phosphate-dependent enzyme [Anaerolineae bacterium]